MKFEFSSIGIIHSPYAEPVGVPIQGVYGGDAIATVEVSPELREGLSDLEGFSHIILLYCCSVNAQFRVIQLNGVRTGLDNH